jgi:hypothetical protein
MAAARTGGPNKYEFKTAKWKFGNIFVVSGQQRSSMCKKAKQKKQGLPTPQKWRGPRKTREETRGKKKGVFDQISFLGRAPLLERSGGAWKRRKYNKKSEKHTIKRQDKPKDTSLTLRGKGLRCLHGHLFGALHLTDAVEQEQEGRLLSRSRLPPRLGPLARHIGARRLRTRTVEQHAQCKRAPTKKAKRGKKPKQTITRLLAVRASPSNARRVLSGEPRTANPAAHRAERPEHKPTCTMCVESSSNASCMRSGCESATLVAPLMASLLVDTRTKDEQALCAKPHSSYRNPVHASSGAQSCRRRPCR